MGIHLAERIGIYALTIHNPIVFIQMKAAALNLIKLTESLTVNLMHLKLLHYSPEFRLHPLFLHLSLIHKYTRFFHWSHYSLQKYHYQVIQTSLLIENEKTEIFERKLNVQ